MKSVIKIAYPFVFTALIVSIIHGLFIDNCVLVKTLTGVELHHLRSRRVKRICLDDLRVFENVLRFIPGRLVRTLLEFLDYYYLYYILFI